MQKTILQIPLAKDLKTQAEKAALNQGFSSLQELVRVFLSKVATNKVEVTIQDGYLLSSKNEKRYMDMTGDFQNSKDVYTASNAKDLFNKLNDPQIS